VPAELSGSLDIEEALARLPHLTVHLVDIPERLWVADPATLTVWVHKGAPCDQRSQWAFEASLAIARARTDLAGAPAPTVPRLHSVPR
jgi:hypothetical protein